MYVILLTFVDLSSPDIVIWLDILLYLFSDIMSGVLFVLFVQYHLGYHINEPWNQACASFILEKETHGSVSLMNCLMILGICFVVRYFWTSSQEYLCRSVSRWTYVQTVLFPIDRSFNYSNDALCYLSKYKQNTNDSQCLLRLY